MQWKDAGNFNYGHDRLLLNFMLLPGYWATKSSTSFMASEAFAKGYRARKTRLIQLCAPPEGIEARNEVQDTS